MFSSCDLTVEFDLQEVSCDSNKHYPELTNNSTYYEETPLYSEINEPHIEPCKSTKTKQASAPVEIRQEFTQNVDLPPISWNNYDSVPKILNVINTGRTILINGHWAKNRPYITGGPLNGNYIFSQIHFHSPSEHEINGKSGRLIWGNRFQANFFSRMTLQSGRKDDFHLSFRYPLEMHVVHYKTSYLTQERAMEEKDGTVVIVYLFQVLNSKKSVFSSITNLINFIEKVNDKMELTDIALSQILQPVVSNYYIYWGSVSTSKNSYLLQWIISCSNLCVTQDEVNKLVRILSSNESFVHRQASKMNIVNNLIYHVEEGDYSLPLKLKCSNCNDVLPKRYCRYHCQRCTLCTNHKDECLHFNNVESNFCESKELENKNETLSCERTSKTTSKSSLSDYKQKKKGKKKVKTSATSSGSSINSDSQSSVCQDEKKNKNKKNAPQKEKSFHVDKTSKFNDRRNQKHINFTKLETSSSCPSTKNTSKTKIFVEKKGSKEKDQKTKSNKVRKSEGGPSKNSSKTSIKKSEQSKKKVAIKTSGNVKSTDSNLKLNKNNKKEKQKSKLKSSKKKELKNSKQKKTDECSESSEGDSKNSGGEKQDHKNNTCDVPVEIQCMPVLVNTIKTEERLEMESNSLEENNKEKMEESKEEIEELFINYKKSLQSQKDVKAEKTSISSEPDDDIKTIFEKKQDLNSPASNSKNCTVNFLLAPNTLQSKCSPVTSESKPIEVKRNICAKSNTPVDKSANETRTFKFSSNKSQKQSEDICFQVEHLFRTEKKGDFSKFVTQEYNVVVICNHNVLQEFRGTFHPNKLELGTYEKLHLISKYPEPENISVRLDDCFVKMETLNQLYLRTKFLLNKTDINSTDSKIECRFEGGVKVLDLKLSDAKNSQSDCIKEEKLQKNNKIEPEIISNQLDLNNTVLEKEECKVELLEKPDSDPKQSSENITFGSLQQSSELEKDLERRENNLIENSDKLIKDLFYKRNKKVYFTCEKIEKDENSGRKIFVGSFRTKAELKALSKEKKVGEKAAISFSGEEKMESDKEKNLFLSSSEESFEEVVETKNSMEQQDHKFQSPAKCREPDKPDESKNLITLHKHKPKNSQVNYNKDEYQISSKYRINDQKILIQTEILSLKDKEKSEKLDIDPFLVYYQRLLSNKPSCYCTRGKGVLSKVEVIPTEHLKKNENTVEKEEKEYIFCLNCYH